MWSSSLGFLNIVIVQLPPYSYCTAEAETLFSRAHPRTETADGTHDRADLRPELSSERPKWALGFRGGFRVWGL